MTTYLGNGPKRGYDRAVLLAHGAGTDLTAPALVVVAEALAEAGIPSLRFNYPYRDAGRKAPDRALVLLEATRAAVAELARRSRLPVERLVVGGRSMGGRYCSMTVGAEVEPVRVLGLLLLGYPLHAAGRPEKVRDDHFPRITVPTLFVSGTRDALAAADDLERAAQKVEGPVSWCWLETADHGFKPLRSSGRSLDDVLATAAAATVQWVSSLDAGGVG
ncbi:MAG: alpha/beta family hydrolase [Actinomycetes bacterium]